MAAPSVPSPDIIASRKYGATVTVALSATTNKTAALTPGTLYYLSSNIAWHMKQGPQATVTSSTSEFRVAANAAIEVYISETAVDDGIAAVASSGTGTLYVMAGR